MSPPIYVPHELRADQSHFIYLVRPKHTNRVRSYYLQMLTRYSRPYFAHCLYLQAAICNSELSRGPFKSDEVSLVMVKCHMNSPHTAINMLGLSGNDVGKAMKFYLYMQMTFQDYFAKTGIEKVTQFMYEVKVFEFTEYVWQRRLIILAPLMEAETPDGVIASPVTTKDGPDLVVPDSALDGRIIVHRPVHFLCTDILP